MADNYFEIQLKINPEIEDIVSNFCFETLPCEGVVLAEETYKDLEMVSTTEGNLRIFINPDFTENKESINETKYREIFQEYRQTLIENGFSETELGSWELTFQEKTNEDWSKKWKEKWDVTHVSERITVVPDWLEYTPKNENEVIIRLEPGCAFGTGTHETTQLCMLALEKYLQPNSTVADIGMGSGILSICAVKMGAKSAYGCDNDDTVIEVAKENARKNNVPTCNSPDELNSGCYFELGTADKINLKFDFIMANILHNVLNEIMGDLKSLMNTNAYLALSGILDEKKEVVLEAIQRENLTIIEEIHLNQWVGYVVKKNN